MNDDDAPAEARPIKLLQGYVWHPAEWTFDLLEHLPRRLEPDVHVLADPLPHAPFAFFDDGTPSSTQTVYQFTVLTFDVDEASAARLVPWLAEVLQRALEGTPEGVGWQVTEDLRPVA